MVSELTATLQSPAMTLEGRPAAPLKARTCLVLGGARSGKSSYAQQLVEASGFHSVFVATAQAWDGEMADRIATHRTARGSRWSTVEEPLALVETLARLDRPDTALLVDCLTLWLTNLMLGGHPHEQAVNALAALLPGLSGRVVLVSNEVGAGIVPDTPLGRSFRDAQGRLNQAVAAACDAVVVVTAGLPLILKPASRPEIVL
jgi:adenosylcobinamide kinase/adenosylcobinamide-phosphate guanylyltransferase